MGWKDWLNKAKQGSGGRSAARQELSVEDLITLERYEEAATRLREQVDRRKHDPRLRQRLADVLVKTGQRAEAVELYLGVADSYAREGFYEKAGALLASVNRRFPGVEPVESRLRRLERERRLDKLRRNVTAAVPMSEALRIEQLWKNIIEGQLVERLSEKQIVRVLTSLAMREFSEGSRMAAAGERRDELWWIVEGEVSARFQRGEGSETELRAFGPGAVVGERALLEREVWPANYVAAKKTVVLQLTRKKLEDLLKGEEDPRGFLDALRADRHDQDVAEMVTKITHRA